MDTKAKPSNSFGKFPHQCSTQRTVVNDAFVNDAKGEAFILLWAWTKISPSNQSGELVATVPKSRSW